jgi:toxin CcdB
MAQFDLYKNLNPNTNTHIPYLLDIQNDILKNLTTTVVVPFVLNMKPAKHLNPKFTIENQMLTMSTAELAAIPRSELGNKVLSLEDYRLEIISAIDFLVTGF